MKPNLSLIMPAIRHEKWLEVYRSITAAWSRSFELVIIGPYPPSEELMATGHVKYVEDWGSPARCQQRGFLASTGDYIGFALDDGLFVPSMLDRLFLYLQGSRAAVTGKFFEGAEAGHMTENDYYYFRGHPIWNGLTIPHHYLAMAGPYFVAREHVETVGGWDCRFETVSISYCDFAMRLQNSGILVTLGNGIVVKFGHMPADTGDHGPMFRAHNDHDVPLFRSLYQNLDGLKRTRVDPDNWKLSPEIWEERFHQKS
jgi:glycosyltransferase involved in cell wall biosynthesis